MTEIALRKKIKLFIKQNKFIEAIELLEDIKSASSISLKYLSLLYRYYGQLEKEITLFEKYEAISTSDDYLINRAKDLQRNMLEHLVPRKTLNVSRKNHNPIREAILSKSKLCFVVPSNDEYYSLLTECLSSILSCNEFNQCPVFIANCGLSNARVIDLKKISNRINVVEVDEVLTKHNIHLNQEKKHLSALLFRGFFDELFAEFDYCFYLDSDAWIQDQSCLYDYIKLAMSQGIALPKHPFNVKVSETNHWLNRNTLTAAQKKNIIGYPAIINCCICVRIKSKEYRDYKKTLLKNVAELGANWGVDQEVFLYVAAKYKLKTLPNEYAYEGAIKLKIKNDGSHTLFSKNNRVIKIFHLGGGLMFKNRKWNYFTEAEWQYEINKKIKLATSTHFFAPKWNDRSWIYDELNKI